MYQKVNCNTNTVVNQSNDGDEYVIDEGKLENFIYNKSGGQSMGTPQQPQMQQMQQQPQTQQQPQMQQIQQQPQMQPGGQNISQANQLENIQKYQEEYIRQYQHQQQQQQQQQQYQPQPQQSPVQFRQNIYNSGLKKDVVTTTPLVAGVNRLYNPSLATNMEMPHNNTQPINYHNIQYISSQGRKKSAPMLRSDKKIAGNRSKYAKLNLIAPIQQPTQQQSDAEQMQLPNIRDVVIKYFNNPIMFRVGEEFYATEIKSFTNQRRFIVTLIDIKNLDTSQFPPYAKLSDINWVEIFFVTLVDIFIFYDDFANILLPVFTDKSKLVEYYPNVPTDQPVLEIYKNISNTNEHYASYHTQQYPHIEIKLFYPCINTRGLNNYSDTGTIYNAIEEWNTSIKFK